MRTKKNIFCHGEGKCIPADEKRLLCKSTFRPHLTFGLLGPELGFISHVGLNKSARLQLCMARLDPVGLLSWPEETFWPANQAALLAHETRLRLHTVLFNAERQAEKL